MPTAVGRAADQACLRICKHGLLRGWGMAEGELTEAGIGAQAAERRQRQEQEHRQQLAHEPCRNRGSPPTNAQCS